MITDLKPIVEADSLRQPSHHLPDTEHFLVVATQAETKVAPKLTVCNLACPNIVSSHGEKGVSAFANLLEQWRNMPLVHGVQAPPLINTVDATCSAVYWLVARIEPAYAGRVAGMIFEHIDEDDDAAANLHCVLHHAPIAAAADFLADEFYHAVYLEVERICHMRSEVHRELVQNAAVANTSKAAMDMADEPEPPQAADAAEHAERIVQVVIMLAAEGEAAAYGTDPASGIGHGGGDRGRGRRGRGGRVHAGRGGQQSVGGAWRGPPVLEPSRDGRVGVDRSERVADNRYAPVR